MALITCPLMCPASGLASQATTGALREGSNGSKSSSARSSGSTGSGAPGIEVEEIRVMPPGPMQLAVTPMLASSRLMLRVMPTMAALAAA